MLYLVQKYPQKHSKIHLQRLKSWDAVLSQACKVCHAISQGSSFLSSMFSVILSCQSFIATLTLSSCCLMLSFRSYIYPLMFHHWALQVSALLLIHLWNTPCFLQQWKYLCKARSWGLTIVMEIQGDKELFSCFIGPMWFVFPKDFWGITL